MFDFLRTRMLRLLRVPHDPDPPTGAPGSLRVFRAGRNYYKLRLVSWGLGQVGALIGIIFSLVFLERMERGVEDVRHEIRQAAAADAAKANAKSESAAPATTEPLRSETLEVTSDQAKSPKKRKGRADWKQRLGRTAERWPMWVFPLLKLLEWGGVIIYLIQIPITYAMARLDYELRWYMVTDRSLRIRSGLATVQEITMSFANVQQVVVTQGPLQRLLGVANVQVQSAGGGGGDHEEATHGNSSHAGIFQGVENAPEIRDLILARLREFREAGLGDPDERRTVALPESAIPAEQSSGVSAVVAGREVLEEIRALRRTLTAGT